MARISFGKPKTAEPAKTAKPVKAEAEVKEEEAPAPATAPRRPRKPKAEPAPVVEETQAEEYAQELENKEQEEKKAPATRAVAHRPAAGPVTSPLVSDEEDGSDAIDFRDIIVPRLNIAQKVGDLGEKFDPGTIVFDQTLEMPQPVEIIVLALQPKAYVERVEGGGMGQIASTPREVQELGGTLDFNEAKKSKIPWFQDMVTAVLLVAQPEDVEDSDLFNVEYEGNRFALALYSMKGAAFTEGCKTLYTARKLGTPFSLRAGYPSQVLTFKTWLKPFRTGNKAYVPKFEAVEPTPEEFQKFALSLIKG